MVRCEARQGAMDSRQVAQSKVLPLKEGQQPKQSSQNSTENTAIKAKEPSQRALSESLCDRPGPSTASENSRDINFSRSQPQQVSVSLTSTFPPTSGPSNLSFSLGREPIRAQQLDDSEPKRPRGPIHCTLWDRPARCERASVHLCPADGHPDAWRTPPLA